MNVNAPHYAPRDFDWHWKTSGLAKSTGAKLTDFCRLDAFSRGRCKKELRRSGIRHGFRGVRRLTKLLTSFATFCVRPSRRPARRREAESRPRRRMDFIGHIVAGCVRRASLKRLESYPRDYGIFLVFWRFLHYIYGSPCTTIRASNPAPIPEL